MIRPLALALVCMLALLASPALGQEAPPLTYLEYDEDVRARVYGSGGLAWSGELGLEVEVGAQLNLGPLQLRFAPLNLSMFDGDLPPGLFINEEEDGWFSFCRDIETGGYAYEDECTRETDAEWRSVAEAQLHLGGGLYLGAGAAYQLHGEFEPEDGRLSTFLSLSTQVEEDLALELRAGREYIALRLSGAW